MVYDEIERYDIDKFEIGEIRVIIGLVDDAYGQVGGRSLDVIHRKLCRIIRSKS